MKFPKLNRVAHRWGSIIIALPLLVVILSGILLLLKKEFAWIQPATQKGASKELSLSFDQILEIAKSSPDAEIDSWDDINRLDVRPSKGIIKVRGTNSWELQIDANSGELLQSSYRRSDLIESLHDGSFFHQRAKLWVFLPSAVLLLGLWITGIYLFFLPSLTRRRQRKAKAP